MKKNIAMALVVLSMVALIAGCGSSDTGGTYFGGDGGGGSVAAGPTVSGTANLSTPGSPVQAGSWLQIDGAGFHNTQGNGYVNFTFDNGASAHATSYTTWNDTQIVCQIPPQPSRDVRAVLNFVVVLEDGTQSSPQGIDYSPSSSPSPTPTTTPTPSPSPTPEPTVSPSPSPSPGGIYSIWRKMPVANVTQDLHGISEDARYAVGGPNLVVLGRGEDGIWRLQDMQDGQTPSQGSTLYEVVMSELPVAVGSYNPPLFPAPDRVIDTIWGLALGLDRNGWYDMNSSSPIAPGVTFYDACYATYGVNGGLCAIGNNGGVNAIYGYGGGARITVSGWSQLYYNPLEDEELIHGVSPGDNSLYLAAAYGKAYRLTNATKRRTDERGYEFTLEDLNQDLAIQANLNAVAYNDFGGYGMVYFVGDGGTILRYDGESKTPWVKIASNTTANLNNIVIYDSANAYIVGDNGTILLFNPTTGDIMKSQAPAGTRNLYDVGVYPEGQQADLNSARGRKKATSRPTAMQLHVWIVGANGTMLTALLTPNQAPVNE
jgi:hypothetical protein